LHQQHHLGRLDVRHPGTSAGCCYINTLEEPNIYVDIRIHAIIGIQNQDSTSSSPPFAIIHRRSSPTSLQHRCWGYLRASSHPEFCVKPESSRVIQALVLTETTFVF